MLERHPGVERGLPHRPVEGRTPDAAPGSLAEPGLGRPGTGDVADPADLLPRRVDLGDGACATSGISALEQTLADNGVVGGIIHARPGISSWLAREHLIERPSTRLMTTPYGTPYSFGMGYDGSAPQGTAPTGSLGETTEWIYATGQVRVWRGDAIVPPVRQVLNRTTNQQYAIAERPYLVGVECGIWAVQITTACVEA